MAQGLPPAVRLTKRAFEVRKMAKSWKEGGGMSSRGKLGMAGIQGLRMIGRRRASINQEGNNGVTRWGKVH